jgi:hypothetical protein
MRVAHTRRNVLAEHVKKDIIERAQILGVSHYLILAIERSKPSFAIPDTNNVHPHPGLLCGNLEWVAQQRIKHMEVGGAVLISNHVKGK